MKQKRTQNETIPPRSRHSADTINRHKPQTAKRGSIMTARGNIHDIDGKRRPARLQAASTGAQLAAKGAAGPFEPASPRRSGASVGEALVTGLLVVYPAFATVAAIVVGLMLGGAGA
jgi:hypothetical protein